MDVKKISFKNSEGQELAGRLEFPINQHPHNIALFAHCFTCSKNLVAIKNISKALVSKGFAVLRFDFTGLGESAGEFADTNFAGNVADLISAADYLKEHYRAPTLLVGHSLGGAAVLMAADKIASVKAVATIGAPSNPLHIKRLLHSSIEEINTSGKAKVQLGGREFTIKKQFLEDLEKNALQQAIKQFRIPLLILHAPQDRIVEISNAEDLYKAAHHPKSFISLDGADHLLQDKEDSLYAGSIIASWAYRYLEIPREETLKTTHQVVAGLGSTDGFTTQMKVGRHYMVADEPADVGGNDFGPSPYELVSAGLAACTAMTLQLYAKRKEWPLQEVRVHTSYGKTHAEDCKDCEADDARIDTFHRILELEGPLDRKQKERLLEIANKCPVHRTLHSKTQVITRLENMKTNNPAI